MHLRNDYDYNNMCSEENWGRSKNDRGMNGIVKKRQIKDNEKPNPRIMECIREVFP